MKIEINRSDAETAFKKVSSVNQSNSLPVLNESLIDFKDGRMIVYASDTEISILTSAELVSSEGELNPIVANTNMIMKTIATLKSETIFLEVKEMDIVVTIPKSKKEYSIPMVYKPDSFLKKSVGNTVDSILLPGVKFHEMIKSAEIFVNPNDLRKSLAGISVSFDDEHLKFFGGTGSCFNFLSIKSENNLGKVIIPKSIKKIMALFNQSASIEICVDDSKTNLIIINGHDIYSVRLIDAPLVDAEKISTNFVRDNYVHVDREVLLQCIGRLIVYTNHDSAEIEINFSGDEMAITAEDIAFRKKGVETLPFLVKEGDLDFKCTVNAKYLSDSLRSFSCEQIIIMKSSGPTPILLCDDGHRGFSSEYFVSPTWNNNQSNN